MYNATKGFHCVHGVGETTPNAEQYVLTPAIFSRHRVFDKNDDLIVD
jgi:hypothetical protein